MCNRRVMEYYVVTCASGPCGAGARRARACPASARTPARGRRGAGSSRTARPPRPPPPPRAPPARASAPSAARGCLPASHTLSTQLHKYYIVTTIVKHGGGTKNAIGST